MNFLQGKKTYIGAGLLALGALAGFFFGTFEAPQAIVILGAAASVAGLGAKFQRYAPAIVSGLQELKKVQQDLKAGKKIDVGGEVLKAGEIALSAELGDRA
jgi:hypothetical protein